MFHRSNKIPASVRIRHAVGQYRRITSGHPYSGTSICPQCRAATTATVDARPVST
jgi:hypothetical protein